MNIKNKGHDFAVIPASMFFSFFLTVSSLLCPISAFGIPVATGSLVFACFFIAAAFSVCTAYKRRIIWLGLPAAFIILFLLAFGPNVFSSFDTMLEAIEKKFRVSYSGFPGISFRLGESTADTATFFFVFYALITSFVTAWAVSKKRSPWVVLAVCLPNILVSMFIVKSPPKAWTLIVFLAAFALLVLTNNQRKQGSAEGVRLMLRISLPVAALAFALVIIFPFSSYTRPALANELRAGFNGIIEKLTNISIDSQTGQFKLWQGPGTSTSGIWKPELDTVDLSNVGPQKKNGIHVMSVKAPETGTIYLRAVSHTTYADSMWFNNIFYGNDFETEPYILSSAIFSRRREISLKTDFIQSVIFTPYYITEIPQGYSRINDSYIHNSKYSTEYSVKYSPVSETVLFNLSSEEPSQYDKFVFSYYTSVYGNTEKILLTMAAEAGILDLPLSERPKAVVELIHSLAVYDLNAPKAPAREDFVIWFLTQSHRGYCTHFATATAVMLKSIGIPARYVTGYKAIVKADKWVNVTDDDAHAWVEYYVAGVGWIPLEATSGSAGSLLPQQSVAQSETTAETTEPSNPADTQTSRPSSGTETTKPENDSGKPWINFALGILLWLLIPGGIGLALWVYRIIVLRRRYLSFYRGTSNARALAVWGYLERLSMLAGAEIPPSLEDIALKAKFSRHTLGEDELPPLFERASALTEMLSHRKGIWKRFLYKLVYVIY